MSAKQNSLVALKNKPADQLFVYFMMLIARILSLVMLRFFSVVIAFTLIMPIMLIVLSLDATPFNAAIPILLGILWWPVSITGRTSYTQDDFDLLVFGWTILAVVIGFIANKLGIRLHVRFRHQLLMISGIFVIACLVLLLNPQQNDKAALILFFFGVLVVSLIAAVFARLFSLTLKQTGKYL